MMKQGGARKIIAIVGPTAVGKSALAVQLARRFNGEVISADSRQVYKGLNIGTGKITKKEMRGVPHHLLDVADPSKQFSVVGYQELAREKISEIFSRDRVPIICGGTGLYVDSVLRGIRFPEVPPDLGLRRRLEIKPAVELFAILKKLDSRRAKTVDSHNPRRLIRAIEIAHSAEKTRTARGRNAEKENNQNTQSYDALWIGLTIPPNELKEKISIRLFARLQPERSDGGQARIRRYKMIREVQQLHKSGLSWKRMEELGLEYRYISRYLCKVLTREEMLAKLQTEIYRYAKRQMTWFKRNRKIEWFSPAETSRIEKETAHFLRL